MVAVEAGFAAAAVAISGLPVSGATAWAMVGVRVGLLADGRLMPYSRIVDHVLQGV